MPLPSRRTHAPPKRSVELGMNKNFTYILSRIWLISHRHTFSREEKLAYLDAEKCLMKLPATLGLPGTRTRFDELQAAHAMQAEVTHGVVRQSDH